MANKYQRTVLIEKAYDEIKVICTNCQDKS